MIEEELVVTNPKGVHARPSALIVKTAVESGSSVFFTHQNETIDASQIMDVLAMGAACGDAILVRVESGNESATMNRMREIFTFNFGDTD